MQTHGAGPSFWRLDGRPDFSSVLERRHPSVAVHAIWLSLWLSLAVSAINTVVGVAHRVGPRARPVPGQAGVEGSSTCPSRSRRSSPAWSSSTCTATRAPCTSTCTRRGAGLLVALLFVTAPVLRARGPAGPRVPRRARRGRRDAPSARAGSESFGPSCCPRSSRRCSAGSALRSHARSGSSARSRSSRAGSRRTTAAATTSSTSRATASATTPGGRGRTSPCWS